MKKRSALRIWKFIIVLGFILIIYCLINGLFVKEIVVAILVSIFIQLIEAIKIRYFKLKKEQ
jgi:hypothetical protein